MKFQVGDWVISRYRIQQITKMEGNAVREITDGYIRQSALSLNVRPLNLRSKVFAESFQRYDEKLRNLNGSNSLNWPDISRHFEALCMKAIDYSGHLDEGQMNPYLKEGQEFVSKVQDAMSVSTVIDGVRLRR